MTVPTLPAAHPASQARPVADDAATPGSAEVAIPAAASLAVRAVLDGESRGVEVVASFPRAAYLTVGEDLLGLVTPDGVLLPNAVVLPAGARPLASLHRGQRGRVGDGLLDIGPLLVRVTRWWDPRPRLRPAARDVLGAAARDVARSVGVRRGDPPAALATPLAAVQIALIHGDADAALAAAARLVGFGPGLTPAGDDILCGVVSGVQLLAPAAAAAEPDRASIAAATDVAALAAALGTAVADLARHRTTAVSAALLRHAARGEVADPASGLLRALTGHGDLVKATDELLAVGSTSGRDLTLGLLAAVDVVMRVVVAGDHPPVGRAS